MFIKTKHIDHLVKQFHKKPTQDIIYKITSHLRNSVVSWNTMIDIFESQSETTYPEGKDRYNHLLEIMKIQLKSIELLLHDIETVQLERPQSFKNWEDELLVQEKNLNNHSKEDEELIRKFIDENKHRVKLIENHIKDLKKLEQLILEQEV